MSQPTVTKSKPRPWIPPGRGMPQYKKRTKPLSIVKKKIEHVPKEVSPEELPNWNVVNIPRREAHQDIDADMRSLSSHSSYELDRINQESELGIHQVSLLREMKLLYVHFESLKTSYLSAHRLIDSQDINDSSVRDLLAEAGSLCKSVNALFDDLEYSMSVFENTLNESQKNVEFSTVLRNKEKLLSTLLEMYEKTILIFQIIFEKQDFKELSRLQESLSTKLKIAEKKCSSQDAIITDLERKNSILQSKTATLESYKTNLESAKVELEKALLHKESQIKYLTTELMDATEKYAKSDHEDFIKIIEEIKDKALKDKSALKKALKTKTQGEPDENLLFMKAQSKEKEETYKKILEEVNEKEKSMFKLAAERDHYKVQLTIVKNNVVQLKEEIEEMKLQNLKFQNEMADQDSSYKKQISQLKFTIEEKSTELKGTLKKIEILEETIEELESKLKKSRESFKTLESESAVSEQINWHKSKENGVYEEIPQLIALLQNTREMFENFIHSGYNISTSADPNTELGNYSKDVLAAVSETNKHILELKNQLMPFLSDQKSVTEPENSLKKNAMEYINKSAAKDNEPLKHRIEDLQNSNGTILTPRNYFPADPSNNNMSRNFQVELYKKDKEIATLKFELAQQEKVLGNQIREYEDKLRTLEMDNIKMARVEEELKNVKLDLSVLQTKKEEEAASLLLRVQELQESLDKKIDECKNLEQYIQLLKHSYYKVFS